MSVTKMSLDNTSHPGRPGRDELVPSRYALRVGAIDVMVVSDADFSRVSMPPGFPDALRRTAKRFLNEYGSQLQPFEKE